MSKFRVLYFFTLLVVFQFEAKSAIIEIDQDFEHENHNDLDYYDEELDMFLATSVQNDIGKPGYCKYCKFCKFCPCDNDPNCKYCKYCWMCNVFCLTDKSQKWDGPIFQTPQIVIVM